ncbi:MAG: hypothetical protein JXB17_01525 [Bacteroidales bacterium]|nr:hypothetical protein [Bacteroidales bacterium]
MFLLTKGNIRLITETIDKAEITFSHLRDDLIDHMCCEIETEMQRGLNFQKAFAKIKKHVGIKDLQEVQEKTILLIDKNYCTMKKTMKISGIISIALLMFGSLFKIQHWPGAGIMLTLGFFILCILFLPSANYMMHRENRDRSLILLFISVLLGSLGFFSGILFKIQHWPGAGLLLTIGIGLLCILFLPLLLRYLLRKAETGREKGIYIIAVFSGIIYLSGLLFKMMHWPFAGLLLAVGSIGIVCMFIPLYTFYKYRQSKRVEVSFLYIIVSITWFILFSMLISMGVSRDILEEFVNTEQKIQYTNSYFHEKNDLIYANYEKTDIEPQLEKVKTLSDDLDNYINNLKIEIIKYPGEENLQAIDKNNKINVDRIINKDNFDASTAILLSENKPGKAIELKEKIEYTKNQFIQLINEDRETSQLIEYCLNTALPENAPEWINTWEVYYFEHKSIIACMNILSGLQRNLELAENEVINYLIKQNNYEK